VASAVPGPVFVLVHSPLVGPTSWLPVARELERRGRVAVVPSLLGVAGAAAPQWRHVPEAVRAATARIGEPIVLAGHSGGGLLLPAIADAVAVEVAALVFVDSFLPPTAGWLPLAPPAFMEQLRALAGDGVLAPWSSWFGADAMRDLVGDERLRAALEAEMPRLPLSYFEASVPLPDGWHRRPCAYLLSAPSPIGKAPPRPGPAAGRWPRSRVSSTWRRRLSRSPSPRRCSTSNAGSIVELPPGGGRRSVGSPSSQGSRSCS
jgi:pimeloyl-ACP methyl ester carboxylesterase